MKSLHCVVFLILAVAVFVDCFPREREVESVEDESEDIPLPSIPAVAVPAGPTFGYIPSFYSFFPDFDLVSRIRGLVTRLRTQIGDSFGDIDWSKGNTTSTTKVIDGHIVTVNETSYKDDDTDLVLHVKVIDVKPTEGAEGTSDESSESSPKTDVSVEEAGPAPSATGSEETLGNEIPKQPEEGVAESLDYDNHPEDTREHLLETREYNSPDYSIDYVDTPVNEVDNAVEVFEPSKPIRLDNDIYINKLMSDKEMSGGMREIPEDVEVFAPENKDIYETIGNNGNSNENYVEFVPNNRNVYETVPYSGISFRPRSEKLMSLT